MLPVDPKLNVSGVSPQDILDILEEKVRHAPLPETQSPWEIIVVPNFRDTPRFGKGNDEGGVGTMLLFRFDHALGN